MFEEFPGWTEDISKVQRFADLPTNTQKYLRAIETLAGIPIIMVSVGPRRNETIILSHPFENP